jgi:hypothetical protein
MAKLNCNNVHITLRTVIMRAPRGAITRNPTPIPEEDKAVASEWLDSIPQTQFEESKDDPMPLQELYKFAAWKKKTGLTLENMESLDRALRWVVRTKAAEAMRQCMLESE